MYIYIYIHIYIYSFYQQQWTLSPLFTNRYTYSISYDRNPIMNSECSLQQINCASSTGDFSTAFHWIYEFDQMLLWCVSIWVSILSIWSHYLLLYSIYIPRILRIVRASWWRHQMETSSALLALCVENAPVTGEFPAQRPVTRSFDVFFDLHLNKRLSKQS